MAFMREFLVAACIASAAEGFQMGRVGGFGVGKTSPRSAVSPLALYMDAALILQNKGGGHGEIGYHLAKQLKGKGLDVHILQAADAKMDKQPFKSYGELSNMGITIDSLDLADPAALKAALRGKAFTHVFDNFAKDVPTVETVAMLAKKEWNVKSYCYVSSAGMYDAKVAQPMLEDAQTKVTGQREVEMFLDANGLPYTAFRPQYIYGPKTNKRDYLDWFFHRITRDRTCPLPGDGSQLASVSNVEDVAAMLAAVVGKEASAARQVFNCGTEFCVSYQEICNLVGKAVGKQAATVGYNPKEFELPKGAFPFRNTAFYVSPGKAKRLLGWSAKNTLAADMGWYYESYKAAGLDKKDVDFSADDLILAAKGGKAFDAKAGVKEVANSKIKNANPDSFEVYLAKRKAAEEGRVWTPATPAAASPAAPAASSPAASNKPYNAKDGVKEVATSKIKNANPDDFATYMAKRKAADAGVAWYPGYK